MCHGTHAVCTRPSDGFVPKRLLNIESCKQRSAVRLVDTFPDSRVKWAALSYVWGGDQSFKTTVSSLAAMNKSISVLALPRTLQDAVSVCMGLGLSYLWIDCLCIIQDDEEDLARELASMPQIYQRAWITISASTADNATKGFLQDRGYMTEDKQAPISLPYLSKDGLQTGTVIIGEISDYTARTRDRNLPIHQRAWTYQEWRLSPRILDFTDRNLTLICRTGQTTQSGGTISWPPKGTEPWRSTEHSIPCLEDQDLPNWHEIVADYATRRLTVSNDKFKAISALAELYRKKTQQHYVAGLWEETMIQDLCWRTGSAIPSASRPSQYRAPSWSWAAIDLDTSTELVFEDNCLENDTNSDNTGYHKLNVDAKIVDLSLHQDPPNTTYGRFTAGHLTLEGLAHTTTWYYNKHWLFIGPHRVATTRDAWEENWTDDGKAKATVTALLLTKRTDINEPEVDHIFGLLLLETSSAQEYRRVGTFREMLRSDLGNGHLYYNFAGLDDNQKRIDPQPKSEIFAKFLNEFERRTITMV
jgi:hypothetical protein